MAILLIPKQNRNMRSNKANEWCDDQCGREEKGTGLILITMFLFTLFSLTAQDCREL